MEKKEIDDIVEGLIDVVGSNNLSTILKELDIKLVQRPKQQNYYFKNGNKETIFIDSELEDEHKAFVIAHELGHAILHDVELEHYSPFDIVRRKTELEADYFAFKLLGKVIDPIYDYTANQYVMELGVNEDVIKFIIE